MGCIIGSLIGSAIVVAAEGYSVGKHKKILALKEARDGAAKKLADTPAELITHTYGPYEFSRKIFAFEKTVTLKLLTVDIERKKFTLQEFTDTQTERATVLEGIAELDKHRDKHFEGALTPDDFQSLRVRPETLCRITEFSEHESNGRELDEGERVAVEVLPVLGQSAAAVEPGDGAFDHPTPGLDDEALHPIGSLDDLGLEIGQDAGQGAVKDRPLIGAVGEQFPEKGKQTEQGRQQRETAVAILNVGGGDDAVQQQALRIDQNMPLLALDQLAGIEAVAVDASPPFSALFTL